MLVSHLGCTQTESNSKNKNTTCNNATTSGYKTLSANNTTREYIMHIPTNYNAGTAVPLVINLHGYGGCAASHLSDADMRSQANENTFILVYPQGLTRTKGSAEWDPDTDSNDISTSDLEFLKQLISTIASEYTIDATRVYVVGYSNGGMMAYGMACNNSNLVAAIGVVSSTMLQSTINSCNPTHATGVINFHGTSDAVLPYDGNTSFPSVATAIDYWKTYNNIPLANESESDIDSTTKKYTYSGGTNGVRIEHYKITNGGHIWFNQASATLWQFLSNFNTSGRMP